MNEHPTHDPDAPQPVLPVLDYRAPEPAPRSLIRAGTWFCFTLGFAAALVALAALGISRNFAPSLVIGTLFSGVLFSLTTLTRRWLANLIPVERSAWLTLAAGAGCVIVPEAVHHALLGSVDPLPWTITAWAVSVVASSWIVYPDRIAAD
jgi:hypothetical protein